jgi:hypothetical protein
MITRRRFKQTSSLANRLTENVEQLQRELARTPPGPERDRLIKRIRQSEIASHLDEWLSSPGLRPPIEASRLARK